MKISVVNVDQNVSVQVDDARSFFDAVAQSAALFRAHRREITLQRTDTLWLCTDTHGIGTVTVETTILWAEAHRGNEVAERLLTELR